MAGPEQGHRPVMVEEVIMALSPHTGQLQIDATLGGGGHAVRILEASSPDGRLLGLDADQAAIARSRGKGQVSLTQTQTAKITVSNPTVPATMRCPCS